MSLFNWNKNLRSRPDKKKYETSLKKKMSELNKTHNNNYYRSDLDGSFLEEPQVQKNPTMKIIEFPPNQAVFTTRAVATQAEPIVYLTLDTDGDFQAFGEEESDMKNAMIISLRQLLEIAPELHKIPAIQPGIAYVRKNSGSDWEIAEK